MRGAPGGRACFPTRIVPREGSDFGQASAKGPFLGGDVKTRATRLVIRAFTQQQGVRRRAERLEGRGEPARLTIEHFLARLHLGILHKFREQFASEDPFLLYGLHDGADLRFCQIGPFSVIKSK